MKNGKAIPIREELEKKFENTFAKQKEANAGNLAADWSARMEVETHEESASPKSPKMSWNGFSPVNVPMAALIIQDSANVPVRIGFAQMKLLN